VPRALFWLGVLWFALGVLIDFVPGGEQSWFTIAAFITPFGFLVPRQSYRLAALAFVILSAFAAFRGHQRGNEYRQFLQGRHAATPSPNHQP
jgi:membrane protein implicated in regulation of membrane protease activity